MIAVIVEQECGGINGTLSGALHGAAAGNGGLGNRNVGDTQSGTAADNGHGKVGQRLVDGGEERMKTSSGGP